MSLHRNFVDLSVGLETGSIQSYGCYPVVVDSYLMLCRTQCNLSLAWNVQRGGAWWLAIGDVATAIWMLPIFILMLEVNLVKLVVRILWLVVPSSGIMGNLSCWGLAGLSQISWAPNLTRVVRNPVGTMSQKDSMLFAIFLYVSIRRYLGKISGIHAFICFLTLCSAISNCLMWLLRFFVYFSLKIILLAHMLSRIMRRFDYIVWVEGKFSIAVGLWEIILTPTFSFDGL